MGMASRSQLLQQPGSGIPYIVRAKSLSQTHLYRKSIVYYTRPLDHPPVDFVLWQYFRNLDYAIGKYHVNNSFPRNRDRTPEPRLYGNNQITVWRGSFCL